MAQDITATMDGTLLNWLKGVGEAVNSGDIIAEMDADKATVEIEAPASGVLLSQTVQVGDSISEGNVIGQIGAADEASTPAPAQTAPTQQDPPAEAEAAPASSNGASTTEDGRIKASPLAKRIAEDRGVDLSQVAGSGPGGRITKADVEGFDPASVSAPATPATKPAITAPMLATPQRTAPPESADVEYIELSTMRRRVAETTVESQQTIPHFYLTVDVAVDEMMALRKRINDSLAEGATRISVNDMVVKATALTLRKFPNLNSHYYGDKLVHYKRINVGIAVAVPQGGVIYVVSKDADKVALGTLAAENKAMALRAREGKLKPADFQGATFSTSNLGIFDIEHFAAVINPPEAGVLAFGTAAKVPVVKEDGTIGVGQRMKVTLSVDHRVSDGAEGAEFLKSFKDLLENPMGLLI